MDFQMATATNLDKIHSGEVLQKMENNKQILDIQKMLFCLFIRQIFR